MDEEGKVKEEEQTAEESFGEAFDEEPKKGAAPEDKETETPAPDEKKEETPKPDEKKEDDTATLRKRLEDTQRALHEKTEELSKLKTPPKETPKEEEVPEEIKSLYEEYPEIKKIVDFELNRAKKGMPTTQDSEPLKQAVAQMNFERAVIFGFPDKDGNFIEGHPDALKVVTSKDFWKWTEEAKVDGSTTDPRKAIEIIGKYKEAKLKGASAAHDANTRKKAKEMEESAGSMGSGGNRSGNEKAPRKDKNDFDAGFDEA